MYGGTEVTFVCLSRAHELLSRAHELLSRTHDILSQSENTKYIHEYCLRIGDQISSLHCNHQINNTDIIMLRLYCMLLANCS